MRNRASLRIAEIFLNLFSIQEGIDESFIAHMGECLKKNRFADAMILAPSSWLATDQRHVRVSTRSSSVPAVEI